MKLIKQIKKKILLYIIFALPGLIILYPILFGGKIFADGDTIQIMYPSLNFFRSALQSGEAFIWNGSVLTGFVTVATGGGFFSLLNQLIYRITDVFTGYAWLTLFYIWLSSIFTFELVNKLGLRKLSGIFAGLVAPWLMINFLLVPDVSVMAGLFLLQFLMFLLLLFDSRLNFAYKVSLVLIGGFIAGTISASSHYQWLFNAWLAAGLWAVFLAWRGKSFRVLIWSGLGAIIALAVAWPQFKWLIRVLSLSKRAGGGFSAQDFDSGQLVIGDFLSVIFPHLNLPQIVAHPGIIYIGAIPLFFLILSWWGKKDRIYYFFTGLLIASLLVSLNFLPLAEWLHKLPLFSSMHEYSRFMNIGLFAAIILSAYGFDSFISGEFAKNRDKLILWFWRIAFVILVLFMLGSLAINVFEEGIKGHVVNYFENHYQASELNLPIEHYYRVIEFTFNNIKAGSTFPNPLITTAIFSLAIGAGLLYFGRKFKVRNLAVYLALLAVINLGLVDYFMLQTRIVPVNVLQQPPQVVDYLKSQNQTDYRVVSVFPGFASFYLLDVPYGYEAEDNVELLKNILSPNLYMLYGIDGLDTYENLMDRRHGYLLAYLGSDRAQASDRLVDLDIPFEKKLEIFLQRIPVLARYNVRYIISVYPLDNSALDEVFVWQATSHNIPIYLYELADVKPRYYLTSEVMFSRLQDEAQLWDQNLVAIAKNMTLIECTQCVEAVSTPGELKITKQVNGNYIFDVMTDVDQYFIFGQNFIPGWQASVDGQPTEIYQANYVNQAVFIPAGRHQVEFKFQ